MNEETWFLLKVCNPFSQNFQQWDSYLQVGNASAGGVFSVARHNVFYDQVGLEL